MLIDVDPPVGEDYVEAIWRVIDSVDTFIELIGPGWLNARDSNGRRRLDDPNDFVRLALSRALTRVPDDIAALAGGQVLELRASRWEHDVGRLVEVLERQTS